MLVQKFDFHTSEYFNKYSSLEYEIQNACCNWETKNTSKITVIKNCFFFKDLHLFKNHFQQLLIAFEIIRSFG